MSDYDRMPLERFEALADAYGAAVSRWPDAVRETAFGRVQEPPFAAVLMRAAAIDAQLDAWTVIAPDAELSARIVARARTTRRPIRTRARLWWSGIGLAAALTGVAAGVAGLAVVAPAELASSDADTVFGTVSGQES